MRLAATVLVRHVLHLLLLSLLDLLLQPLGHSNSTNCRLCLVFSVIPVVLMFRDVGTLIVGLNDTCLRDDTAFERLVATTTLELEDLADLVYVVAFASRALVALARCTFLLSSRVHSIRLDVGCTRLTIACTFAITTFSLSLILVG